VCSCFDMWSSIVYNMFATAGKAKRHSRPHRVDQMRNSVADANEKTQYKPSRITDEDMTWFAACQTKATEVCSLSYLQVISAVEIKLLLDI